jgi:IS66 Orf2 like protein.
MLVCSKRLEKERFSWPGQGDENGKVGLSQEQLKSLCVRRTLITISQKLSRGAPAVLPQPADRLYFPR